MIGFPLHDFRHSRSVGGAFTLLAAATLVLTGCIPDGSEGKLLASSSVPQQVVLQVINNSCGDTEEEEDSSSNDSGKIKGLSKVIDGFGIPYDERADNYTTSPTVVKDSSYEANKERGIGYAGIEDHYVASLAAGQQHSPDHPEFEDVGVAMFDGLSTKEEQYGCAMRWEYYNPDLSGPAVDGYFDFLKGNGSGHMQYLAVHATVSDKWVIVCPYDWGPALNLPTTGGGKYAGGRLAGLSPAAAEALGISGGDGPENAMTEWWWVENSSQVECGPVSDLSQLTKGPSKDSKGSSKKSDSAQSNTAKVSTAVTAGVSSLASGGYDTTRNVSVAPADANSFKQHMMEGFAHGDLPKNKVYYIVVSDTKTGSDDLDKYLKKMGNGPQSAHFVVGRDGKIAQCVPLDKIARHAGDAPSKSNTIFGVSQERDDEQGTSPSSDHAMDAWSIGIQLVHKKDEASYPQAQMNAVDKLIAYIDKELGSSPKVIKASEWQGVKEEESGASFPTEAYNSSRNHNDVKTVDEAKEAAESNKCSDEEESSNPDAGGKGIAKMAVKIAGSAAPDEPIYGAWGAVPTDGRLSEYVAKKNEVYPGVSGWADCGRCSSTAVKASGADETFPEGDTAAQFAYLSDSPKWQRAGTMRAGDKPDDICKPGDVLVTEGKGHIMIYVGNEAVKKKFPSSNANFFEGMLDKYYCWCYSRPVSQSSWNYAIFRCIKPDNGDAAAEESAGGGSGNDIIKWGETQIGITKYGQTSVINPYIGKNPDWAKLAEKRNADSYKTIAGTTDQNTASTDCFGFTFYCYTSAGYTDYPDHAWGSGGAKEKVVAAGNFTNDPKTLQPGDLVFWENSPHIGIYYGEVNGVPSVIHNAHGVDIEPLETVNGYCGGFTGGGFPYDRAKSKGVAGTTSGGASTFVKIAQNELADWQSGAATGYRYVSWLFPDVSPDDAGCQGGWCAAFIGYCAHKMGSRCANGDNNSGDAFPGEVTWPGHWTEYYQQHPDRGKIRRNDGVTMPQAGDVIIWGEQGVHVEMVESVNPSAKTYTIISGGGALTHGSRSIQDMTATWFVTPNWSLLGYSGGESEEKSNSKSGSGGKGVLSGEQIKGSTGPEMLLDSCRQEFMLSQSPGVGWKYQDGLKEIAEKKEPGCSATSWGGQCSEFCYWNLINIGLKPGEHLPDDFTLNTFSAMPGFLNSHPDIGTVHNVDNEPDFVPQPGDIAFLGYGSHFEVVLEVKGDTWTTYASGGPSVDNNVRPINPEAGNAKYDDYHMFFRYNWDNLGIKWGAKEEDDLGPVYVDIQKAG